MQRAKPAYWHAPRGFTLAFLLTLGLAGFTVAFVFVLGWTSLLAR